MNPTTFPGLSRDIPWLFHGIIQAVGAFAEAVLSWRRSLKQERSNTAGNVLAGRRKITFPYPHSSVTSSRSLGVVVAPTWRLHLPQEQPHLQFQPVKTQAKGWFPKQIKVHSIFFYSWRPFCSRKDETKILRISQNSLNGQKCFQISIWIFVSLFPQMGWEQNSVSLGLKYLKLVKSKESFVSSLGFWMSLQVSIAWTGRSNRKEGMEVFGAMRSVKRTAFCIKLFSASCKLLALSS